MRFVSLSLCWYSVLPFVLSNARSFAYFPRCSLFGLMFLSLALRILPHAPKHACCLHTISSTIRITSGKHAYCSTRALSNYKYARTQSITTQRLQRLSSASTYSMNMNTETERVKNKRQRNLFIERLHCCDNLNCESLCVGLYCFFVNTRPLILFNRNFEMFIFFVSFEMEN